jgi:formylglycine-generating enzyme required for sulfatase activity
VIGKTISHYRVEARIGAGAHGAVYRAVHMQNTGFRVAIKMVREELLGDEDFLGALKRECMRLERLEHPSVVRFRDLCIEDGRVAMIMELLVGHDLHRRITEGPLPVDEVVRVGVAVLSGLEHAHDKDVVHRDIKPSNIYLCDDGRVKLLDFGVARAADNTVATRSGQVVGTLDYIAPERFGEAGAGRASDVYAVGLVMWEMLAGRPACPDGEVVQKLGWHLGVGAPDIRAARPDCPVWLAEVIRSLAVQDPAARPVDGGAALALLNKVREAASRGADPRSVVGDQTPPPDTVTVAKLAKSALKAAAALAAGARKREQTRIRGRVRISVRGWLVLAALLLVLVITGIVGALWLVQGSQTPATAELTDVSAIAAVIAPVVTSNSLGMEFVELAPGDFTMGSPALERGGSDETPHPVTLTRSFSMAATEVTQDQYRALVGSNPSHFSSCGPDCPVERVSWNDAVRFANALSKKEGLRPAYSGSGSSVTWDHSTDGYRLPTEAEWEYAARAGQVTRYSGSNTVGEVAWTSANSDGKTHTVAQKQGNSWGLYDMSGNVWEWCWDWYDRYGEASSDPAGSRSGAARVTRGGSWVHIPRRTRVANRRGRNPSARTSKLGFRLVRYIP